ncbi:MAG: SafA/ExsA family spore coat assembly protein [Dehalobacter sp. 4CP]|uniref:SafA/ExsA family spore coat assembly protein n=1 Tax=Dehalobacter sp. CP TaxID=2594474 RepID=UPI0013C7FA0E|nr:SafA/ExsA family spore coat assembly protein [Dehalobacter sp. 4CP]
MNKNAMNRNVIIPVLGLLFLLCGPGQIFAQSTQYSVQAGDSMWKIAVRYEIGLSELAQANPQIQNLRLIYPGQKVMIPNIDSIKALETEVIRLVNVERAKKGLQQLKQNWELCRVARYKSQDMINKGYFAHESPTYGSPFKMMESFGIRFSAAAENIAYGQQTPQEVMNSWMNSAGHRSNILSPSYLEIGVGAAKDSEGNIHWTQMFIKPL